MRIRWRGLELPTRVVCDRETLTNTYGKFVVEPFERGYGTTIGNSLRRVLLASLEGCAVTTIKIKGVKHEFSSIKGVLEDVTDIILNIKRLVVKMDTDTKAVIRLHKNKKGEAKAGDIEVEKSVEVVNKNLVIATLTDSVELDIEMVVEKGRGYVVAQEHEAKVKDKEVGVIYIDSIFSPVVKVKFTTENTRVGQKTNYDKLTLETWTDGSVSPEMALVEAAKILRKHLNPFVHYFEIGTQIQQELLVEKEEEEKREKRERIQALLQKDLSELDLSVRASNCLENANILTIGDLVNKSEAELIKLRNFGKTSLKEIKKKLTDIGLSLNFSIDDYVANKGEIDEA